MASSTIALFASLALGSVAVAETFNDDFEGPSNVGGWTFGLPGSIDPVGGNPDSWLHVTGLDTFAPILRTGLNPSPFKGDYRAMGVTQISLDATTRDRNFGSPGGFEMSLLLRDTKGTPEVDDDDYAYFVGPQVPQIGEGWVHYDFAIPSQSTDAVPAGWSGGWVGDAENFRPGVDWNDVITSVDKVEIWWLHPAFVAFFATWEVGADNISITTEAPVQCPGDGDENGVIDTVDFLGLLSAWGTNDPVYDIAPDGGDGIVDTLDFLELLANWGPCE